MISVLACLKLPWFVTCNRMLVQWGVEFSRILGWTAFLSELGSHWSYRSLVFGVVHPKFTGNLIIRDLLLNRDLFLYFQDAFRTCSFSWTLWNLTITCLRVDLFLYKLLGRLGGPSSCKNPHPSLVRSYLLSSLKKKKKKNLLVFPLHCSPPYLTSSKTSSRLTQHFLSPFTPS